MQSPKNCIAFLRKMAKWLLCDTTRSPATSVPWGEKGHRKKTQGFIAEIVYTIYYDDGSFWATYLKFLHEIDFNGPFKKCQLQESPKIIFLFWKNKKLIFGTIFAFFGALIWPYLLNHSRYRPKISTQNRLQWALQKMLTTWMSQNYFSILKK